MQALLTEAKLTPTDGAHLEGFHPCEGCRECAEVCPVRAIDADQEPGAGYDLEKCVRFNTRKSERAGRKARTCGQCFIVCPWSMGRLGAVS